MVPEPNFFDCQSGSSAPFLLWYVYYNTFRSCVAEIFMLFCELNSKTLNNGIKNQNYSKTYKLSSGCSYLLTYVRIREGNIAESSLNVGLISTGEKTSAKSLIQWIVKNGQNQSMFEFDETDSSILRVNVPASTWIVMSITKL